MRLVGLQLGSPCPQRDSLVLRLLCHDRQLDLAQRLGLADFLERS